MADNNNTSNNPNATVSSTSLQMTGLDPNVIGSSSITSTSTTTSTTTTSIPPPHYPTPYPLPPASSLASRPIITSLPPPTTAIPSASSVAIPPNATYPLPPGTDPQTQQEFAKMTQYYSEVLMQQWYWQQQQQQQPPITTAMPPTTTTTIATQPPSSLPFGYQPPNISIASSLPGSQPPLPPPSSLKHSDSGINLASGSYDMSKQDGGDAMEEDYDEEEIIIMEDDPEAMATLGLAQTTNNTTKKQQKPKRPRKRKQEDSTSNSNSSDVSAAAVLTSLSNPSTPTPTDPGANKKRRRKSSIKADQTAAELLLGLSVGENSSSGELSPILNGTSRPSSTKPKSRHGRKKSTSSASGSRSRVKKEQQQTEFSQQEDYELFCLCQTPYDETQFYIGCDSCDNWFHGRCVRIAEGDAAALDKWLCPNCTGIPIPPLEETEINESEELDNEASSSTVTSTASKKQPKEKQPCQNPVCGKLFLPRTGNEKYCSQSCGTMISTSLLITYHKDYKIRQKQQQKLDVISHHETLQTSFTELQTLVTRVYQIRSDRDKKTKWKEIITEGEVKFWKWVQEAQRLEICGFGEGVLRLLSEVLGGTVGGEVEMVDMEEPETETAPEVSEPPKPESDSATHIAATILTELIDALPPFNIALPPDTDPALLNDKTLCREDRGRCHKHTDWESLKGMELRSEIENLEVQIRKLVDREVKLWEVIREKRKLFDAEKV